MVPNSILQRTFQVAHNGSAGTAFTIEILNKQYLATAKHVVEGLQANSQLAVMHANAWQAVDIGEVWLSPTGADIALISLKQQLSPDHAVFVGPALPFYLSQQIYFLGFPYGLRLDLGQINNDYPVPFVKSGIISSFTPPGVGSQLIFCDGYNNPGFSGGPIVTVSPQGRVHIIGVVSGYRHNDDLVMLNGNPTGLTYRANTGLVIGYGLNEAVAHANNANNGAPITVRA